MIAEIPCDDCGQPITFDDDEWYNFCYARRNARNAPIYCDDCMPLSE